MKKPILLFFILLSLIVASIGFAQTDSILVRPQQGSQCAFNLTVKNRNASQQKIEEIRLEIVTADGTIWYPATPPAQWGTEIMSGDLIMNFTAQVNLIDPGADKSGFIIDMGVSSTSIDKPITVNWTTLNGSQTISSGSLSIICTPYQFGKIDTATVSTSVVNNDPYFDFTVTNRNDFQSSISRFVAQLQTIGAGTMRPSKITAPAGWELDSVTALYAYFRTTTNPIGTGQSLGGFKVCLRGNPQVNKFTFNWFTYEEGDLLLGRDTIRNISVTFSGSAAEADSVSAAVVNGCLYTLTVKNYHVANTMLPSRIRKVVLWSKTPSLIFTAAPSAPVNWRKTVKPLGDSIIYEANHDSASIPSGKVSNLFRFSVDPPSTTPFTIGWRTFRTLTEGLSTGDLQLQCNEQPPLKDIATLEVIDVCNWNIRITNQHNTPASDLYGIELSIPSGSGSLSTFGSSLGWTKTNETSTSVRFVAPSGAQQGSNTNQSILFAINPQTPGAQIALNWKTFEETGLQTNTPLEDAILTLSCSPVVTLCDTVSAVTEAGSDTCIQNFSVQSKRSVALTTVTMEPQNGWKIDTVMPPAGWDVQLDANKTLVNFTNSTGIAPDGTQGNFRIRFVAVDQGNNFGVKVTTTDVSPRSCDTVLNFTCTSGTSGSVRGDAFGPEQVSVVPNPVSHDATVELVIHDQGRVEITLLDILGNRVAAVSNSILAPGEYRIPLAVGELPTGTYYLRVKTLAGIVTKKVVVSK